MIRHLKTTTDDEAKDGGPGVVCPSCSFYHDVVFIW